MGSFRPSGGFSDPLMDCKCCHERFRADKLIEDYYAEQGQEPEKPIDGWTTQEMKEFIDEKKYLLSDMRKA